MQEAAPSVLEVPISQSVHSLAPAPENLPAGQGDWLEAPSIATWVPAPASVQLVVPVDLENVPAEQSMHAVAPDPLYVPASHAT